MRPPACEAATACAFGDRAAGAGSGDAAGEVSVSVGPAERLRRTGAAGSVCEITAMTEPGFEAERDEAIKTGASAPEFAMSVLQASRDRGVTLAGLRAGAPGAVAHAAAPESNADGSKPWADVVGASPSKM